MDQIDLLREEVTLLDEKIHSQLLCIETLQQTLKEAENSYLSMVDERKRHLEEINHLVAKYHKLAPLPTDLVIKICSFTHPSDFGSIFKVWGDVVYKAVPRTFQFEQLFNHSSQEALQKSSLLQIKDLVYSRDDVRYLLSFLDTAALPFIGRWKELLLVTTDEKLPMVHNSIISIIQACVPHRLLEALVALRVTVQRIGVHYYPGPNSEHRCDGCLQDIQAPACTELSLPLRLLPCFRNVNPGRILHLDVNLGDSLSNDFTWHLRGFHTTNLKTLTIRWDNTIPFLQPTGKVDAPNLRQITTYIKDTISSGEVFSAIGCIACPNLETLDVFDVASVPLNPSQACLLLERIQKICNTLTRLSLYVKLPASQQNFEFVSSFLQKMKAQSAGDVPFPRLLHLAIPHPWINFDQLEIPLRELLENRQENGAPICTIELVIDDHEITPRQQLQIDRLALFVKFLLITRVGILDGSF